MASEGAKRVLVYGGRGALGNVIVQHFKSKGWWVGSIDMAPNDQANFNHVIQHRDSLPEQEKEIVDGIRNNIGGEDFKVDAILCVAGGWAGGNVASADFTHNVDLVIKQSIWSSVIAARLSHLFLKNDGLLTLTGANAALDATPGMIGYGLAKSAVHHLVRSLGAEGSGVPAVASAVAILPVMLDTPMNRKWMPKADTSSWTSLEFVADLLYQWAATNPNRPPTGSLIRLVTKGGETHLKTVS